MQRVRHLELPSPPPLGAAPSRRKDDLPGKCVSPPSLSLSILPALFLPVSVASPFKFLSPRQQSYKICSITDNSQKVCCPPRYFRDPKFCNGYITLNYQVPPWLISPLYFQCPAESLLCVCGGGGCSVAPRGIFPVRRKLMNPANAISYKS